MVDIIFIFLILLLWHHLATCQPKSRYQIPKFSSSSIHQSVVYKIVFLTKLKKIFYKSLSHTCKTDFNFLYLPQKTPTNTKVKKVWLAIDYNIPAEAGIKIITNFSLTLMLLPDSRWSLLLSLQCQLFYAGVNAKCSSLGLSSTQMVLSSSTTSTQMLEGELSRAAGLHAGFYSLQTLTSTLSRLCLSTGGSYLMG